ncbi:hypothetical protein Patl1_15873 [Pistacia atlantica]|uniref:Uncharacterized protein n=1 Tax=Pistacia atlantica TaxID=434234 RepID=A0ACC1B9D5_9ROSI|nr:hypothetical protein Patl1_15873 [Pistacia atlantica]
MTGKQSILPLESKKLPGRPKKNRRKELDERTIITKRSRNGRIMTCNVCKSEASIVDNVNAQRDSSARQKTKQQHKGSRKIRHKKTPMAGYGVYIDTNTGMLTYNGLTHLYKSKFSSQLLQYNDFDETLFFFFFSFFFATYSVRNTTQLRD